MKIGLQNLERFRTMKCSKILEKNVNIDLVVDRATGFD